MFSLKSLSDNMRTAIFFSRLVHNIGMKTPFLLSFCLSFLCAWTLEIDIGNARIGDSRSENIRIRANSTNGRDWQISAQAPQLKHPQGNWQQLRAETWLHYKNGQFSLSRPRFSAQAEKNALYFSAPQHIALRQKLDLAPLSLHISRQAQASPFLQLDWHHQQRELQLVKKNLNIAELNALLAFLHLPPLPPLDGDISLKLLLKQKRDIWQLSGDIDLRIRNWHSPDHLQAVENLSASLNISMQYQPEQGWQGHLRAHIPQGETLFQGLYLNFKQAPLQLESDWQYRKETLSLKNLRANDGQLHIAGGLSYNSRTQQLEQLSLQQFSGAAQALYQHYLKPYLGTDSLFADSDWQGSFYASGDWHRNSGLRNSVLVLHRFGITDRQERFRFPSIDGQIGQSGESRLDIAAATWRKLPLGASKLRFLWQDKSIKLLEPWRIPILNGALVINDIRADRDRQHLLNISLDPIDLAELNRALELPVFQGDISAELPEVRLSSNSLVLKRPVHLNVFGGHILISDLRIEKIFSNQAQLYFSLGLNMIDLQRLTSAFGIAEIRGRVSGFITDVVLANWRPIAFDASIMTDEDNPGERRISHEAVQLLTQIGGSSAAIGQFVRILSSFPYEKLGFSATLRGDLLTIEGVEKHPDGGFYLVKGSGLPHLDIIGHQRRSSYRELSARIKAALNSDEPTIE